MVQEVGDVDACKMLDICISTSIQQISSIYLHGAQFVFIRKGLHNFCMFLLPYTYSNVYETDRDDILYYSDGGRSVERYRCPGVRLIHR